MYWYTQTASSAATIFRWLIRSPNLTTYTHYHTHTARYVISSQTLNLCTANIIFSSKLTQISRKRSSLGLSLQQLSVKEFFISNAKGSTSGEELDQVVSEETGLWCVSSCGGTECTQNKGGFVLGFVCFFATNIIFAHFICLIGTSKNGNHLEGWDILILMD